MRCSAAVAGIVRRCYALTAMKAEFVPRISQPCFQHWSAMAGDDKRRFCDHCQLHVHNLTAMSAAEQQTLLSQRGTRQCIAYLAADSSIRVRTGNLAFSSTVSPSLAGGPCAHRGAPANGL